MVDLDRFKELNDEAGLIVGDEVLAQVAATLQPLLQGDQMLARVGDDEFMAILPGTGIEGAIAVAERLLQALERPVQVGGRPFFVRASIGIAVSPEDGAESPVLVQHAKTAMYEAKSAGGQRYGLYRRQMSTVLQRRIRLSHAVGPGAAQRRAGAALPAQGGLGERPAGRRGGAGALARRGTGLGQPGRIHPAGRRARADRAARRLGLARAACDHRRWSRHGALPWRVAVNVSARQLAQGDFAQRAEAVVRAAGAAPADVELELTETAMAHDPQLARAMADPPGRGGLRLALDDFGTGYSSLSQLHRFRLQKLKIDLEFVQGMLKQPGYHAIVRAVIGMAKAMDLVVVAEGIETREQAEALLSPGLRPKWGWLYGRPLPAGEFAGQWLLREAVQA